MKTGAARAPGKLPQENSRLYYVAEDRRALSHGAPWGFGSLITLNGYLSEEVRTILVAREPSAWVYSTVLIACSLQEARIARYFRRTLCTWPRKSIESRRCRR